MWTLECDTAGGDVMMAWQVEGDRETMTWWAMERVEVPGGGGMGEEPSPGA